MSNDRAGFSQPSAEVERQVLGERLKEAREYVGLKQDDVAKKLGIPRSALSNIEAGSRKVDAIELAQLARVVSAPCGLVHRRRSERRCRQNAGGSRTCRARGRGTLAAGSTRTGAVCGFFEITRTGEGRIRWSIAALRS